MQTDKRSDGAFLLLKIVFGVVPIVAGLDKFFNLLTDWGQYLSPYAAHILGPNAGAFMRAAGVIEIVAGAIVLSRHTRFGAYLVSAWLVCIALNLISTGHYFDVAVRDLVMAASAFALGELATARATATERQARVPEAAVRV